MKLNFDEQIEHFKNKGVTFDIYTEEQAKKYLMFKNHFFRLKSYCKNYQKKPNGDYIKLDFAYLVEIAELDRQFRKYTLKLVVHLEHMIKQKLLREVTMNPNEDGQNIVSDFLNSFPNVLSSICNKKSQSVCNDLITKYENGFSAWNVVEVLSFGELISLYSFYYAKYPSGDNYSQILHHIKFLRNAVAHNNCLFNTLKTPYSVPNFRPSREVSTFILQSGINKERRLKIIENPVLHDFVTALYALIKISSDIDTTKTYLNEAFELFSPSYLRNYTYFNTNSVIISRFRIVEQIIDYNQGLMYNI